MSLPERHFRHLGDALRHGLRRDLTSVRDDLVLGDRADRHERVGGRIEHELGRLRVLRLPRAATNWATPPMMVSSAAPPNRCKIMLVDVAGQTRAPELSVPYEPSISETPSERSIRVQTTNTRVWPRRMPERYSPVSIVPLGIRTRRPSKE